jgi:hypothetical protein
LPPAERDRGDAGGQPAPRALEANRVANWERTRRSACPAGLKVSVGESSSLNYLERVLTVSGV